MNSYLLLGANHAQHTHGSLSDPGARAEDGHRTCLVEEVIVLGGDHAATNHLDVRSAHLHQDHRRQTHHVDDIS
jgi:hypothetical protein